MRKEQNMKRQRLFLKLAGLALVGVLAAVFTACPTEAETKGTAAGLGYNDTPLTAFTGTRWTDDLIPESTIEFTSTTSVTLDGRYWDKKLEINGAQATITLSGTRGYEVANDLSAAAVEPAVYILWDTNRKGIELYYYKSDTTTGKHQRLVVYLNSILQPREFYLH
jgi:hypothetical protein